MTLYIKVCLRPQSFHTAHLLAYISAAPIHGVVNAMQHIVTMCAFMVWALVITGYEAKLERLGRHPHPSSPNSAVKLLWTSRSLMLTVGRHLDNTRWKSAMQIGGGCTWKSTSNKLILCTEEGMQT